MKKFKNSKPPANHDSEIRERRLALPADQESHTLGSARGEIRRLDDL